MKLKPSLNTVTLVVAMLLVAIDQWIKYLVTIYLAPIRTQPLWDGVFQLTYVENPGAAFGMLSGRTFFLVGITGVVILALVILIALKKIKSPLLLWSMSLIIGGGIGNLIDRVIKGYVVDYLHVTFINFPVFNFADCCVVVGTILMVVYFFFFDKLLTETVKNA